MTETHVNCIYKCRGRARPGVAGGGGGAGRGGATFAGLAAAALRRAFFQRRLGDLVPKQRAPLRRFNALKHEQRVAEGKTLDQGLLLLENRAGPVRSLRDRVQAQLREAGPASCAPIPPAPPTHAAARLECPAHDLPKILRRRPRHQARLPDQPAHRPVAA